jgi:very-short-patch-repair endonuclease
VDPWWQDDLDAEGIEVLIHSQDRIVSRPQLLAASEWTQTEIRSRLRRRRWQTVHPGVYATHTGPIEYYARIVAGLLYAGPEASWSHYTAAEQLGLIRRNEDRPVYLTVPAHRVVVRQPGLIIRRTRHWESRRGTVVPPRSTGVHAVLDIVDISASLDDAAAIVAEACQSGRVTTAQLAVALEERVGLRYRRELRPVLRDVAAGSHSLLEIRYLRNVERRHGLPRGIRQRGIEGDVTDVAYDGFGLVVELDGRYHLRPDRRWKDLDRDNRATLRSESTLRYGWNDIQSRPCEAAAQVLAVLRRTTPPPPSTPCSPTCPAR